MSSPGNALIHVVEDNQMLCEAYEFMLQANDFRVSCFNSGRQYLDDGLHSREHAALLLDLCLPDMTGIDLLREVRQHLPTLPVVVITSYGEIPSAVQAMKLGAIDFLEKPVDEAVLLQILHKALNPPAEPATAASEGQATLASLTNREREILQLLALGKTSKEIGRQLAISPATVDVHRNRILGKFGVRSTPQAISMLLKLEKY